MQRVPKLIHFFRGNITLVSEPEFKARKKAYLGQYAWYGWFEKLFYDPAADEFVIDGNSVCLENAYDYAYKTNLEAC
ncbi:MAG: hypothetical protein LBF00_02200 [Mycoplasmataceae bacterium]|nr:hypothetical protein [Mycoplasmataceae bacterium]